MNSQLALGLPAAPPSDTVVINARCTLRTEEEQRVVVVGGLPVYHYCAADAVAEAYALVMLVESGLAQQTEVARAFGKSGRSVRRRGWLESRDLYVQQAALTGESLPGEKQACGDAVSTQPDAENMVFLGTSVVSGTARALIVTTGTATAFGDIAARLAAPPEPTAFERGLKDFSLFLTRTVFFLVLFLIIVAIVRHRDPCRLFIFAVALAVGLTPEFLPMIVSVTLANGARAMARKKVTVKHLAAIQNFGSIDVLCSDKTGTITSGSMTLDQGLDPWGEPSQRLLTLARLNSRNHDGRWKTFTSHRGESPRRAWTEQATRLLGRRGECGNEAARP